MSAAFPYYETRYREAVEMVNRRLAQLPEMASLPPDLQAVARWLSVGDSAEAPVPNPVAFPAATGAERDTRRLLARAVFALAQEPDADPSDADYAVAVVLQRKFEVFGRILPAYTADWRKASNDAADPLTHHLLGLLLIHLYRRAGDPRFLNTALRIADVISASIPFLTHPLDAVSALALLRAADAALQDFYASHEFRMPAHG